MVDLSNLPEELSGTQQADLPLYVFRQDYEPKSDIEVPLLTGCKKQKTADATEVTPAKDEIVSNSKKLPIDKFLASASTYNNYTFALNQ